MKTKILVVLTVLLTLGNTSAYAFLISQSDNAGSEISETTILENTRDEVTTTSDTGKADRLREQRNKYKCSIVRARVNVRSAIYENKYDRHMQVYTDMQENLTELLSDLKGLGYDTSEADAAMLVLTQKVDKLQEDFDVFMGMLDTLPSSICEPDLELEFEEELQAAMAQLKVVRDDMKDIRSYFTDTLKPILLELRNEVKADNAETDNTRDEARDETNSTNTRD